MLLSWVLCASLIVGSFSEKLVKIDLSRFGTLLYKKPDPKVGELMKKYDPETDPRNPEELGNLFQGDMKLPKPKASNGLIGDATSSYRWPNGTVVYVINGNFTASELAFIYQAMELYHNNTCIRFKPRTDEPNYLSIENAASGCWADVGRSVGVTQLNLQPGCANAIGTSIHEFMHALGFFHEHTREDRDEYINVLYDNMIPDPAVYWNFEKVEAGTATTYNVPYDLGSIMHYSGYFFSKDTKKFETMTAKIPWDGPIGQRDGFSEWDVLLINIMYCGASTPPPPSTTTSTTTTTTTTTTTRKPSTVKYIVPPKTSKPTTKAPKKPVTTTKPNTTTKPKTTTKMTTRKHPRSTTLE